MKKKLSAIFSLVTAFFLVTVISASAALSPISGTVLNDQLNFKLDGKAVVPVGDDGSPVLPISYNGTTYLPVRAIGYLLRLGIDWDGSTNTVMIASTTNKPAPTAAAVTKTHKLFPISGAVLNSNLKFSLNGRAVVPVGDDGTPVLPISYNGTTYLPVRAISYLLGLGIDWDGNTKTILISRSGASTSPQTPATTPGWYFTSWEYYKSPSDTIETGGKVGRFANGDTYTDYHEGKGTKNDFINVEARKLSNGTIAASGHAHTKWVDPPTYFSGNDRPTITVNRVVESNWGINGLNIYFGPHTLNPGSKTAGTIDFINSAGQNYVQNYDGTLQMQKSSQGTPGDKRAIIVYLNGYGFKYYYEWRE